MINIKIAFILALGITWKIAASFPTDGIDKERILEALKRLENQLEETKDANKLPLQIGERLPKGPKAGYHEPADEQEDEIPVAETTTEEELLEEVVRKLTANDQKMRVKRKAASQRHYYWPKATVPYFIDRNLPAEGKAAVMEAVAHWEANTCVEFVHIQTKHHKSSLALDLGHSSYVHFVPGSGCSSIVGRLSSGGPQRINLGPSCYAYGFGSVAHEIGHALGFYHETSRPDRDQFVTVHEEKIESARAPNFKKETSANVVDYSIPYDYSSIMHYGPGVYRKTGASGHVLEPREKSMLPAMGQRKRLSFYDIKMANKAYKCLDGCSSLPCENGGYVGPRCSCACPYGFSGRYCQHLAPSSTDCGGFYSAARGELQSPNFPNQYGDDVTCRYLIKAPSQNAKIRLHFTGFAVEKGDEDLCEYDQLEVRLQGPEKNGHIFCGYDLHGKDLVFEGEVLYMELRSDESNSGAGFKVTYTIEDDSESRDWSDWTTWTACSKTCGKGVTYRTRECHNPAGCSGKSLEIKFCYNTPC